jgi:glucokinase
MLLAGDIGGTKTHLALFSADSPLSQPVHEAVFPSRRHDSLEQIVAAFLARHPVPVEAAAFGVAGPVLAGHARITNLTWEISADTLATLLHLPAVHLVNDLVATASAIPVLEPSHLHCLQAGQPQPGGAIAIVAPGTGLGQAFMTWDGNRYHAWPTEGGHRSFGPENIFEMELLHFLLQRYRRVSVERLCSGVGIPNLYDFLKIRGHATEPEWLARELAETTDPVPLIFRHAQAEEPVPICLRTVELFVSLLGSYAGDAGLTYLSTGGLYLGGGFPPRILPWLQGDIFLSNFTAKGRFQNVMQQMPVYVILNPQAALIGAARIGLEGGA